MTMQATRNQPALKILTEIHTCEKPKKNKQKSN